jgi:hypothetical protein
MVGRGCGAKKAPTGSGTNADSVHAIMVPRRIDEIVLRGDGRRIHYYRALL